MHPWLLYEVRKDDIKTRYEGGERSRLASEAEGVRASERRLPTVLLARAGASLARRVESGAEAVRVALVRLAAG